MRLCRGLKETDYQEHHGFRTSPSPMYHYPDLCPHFPGDQIGNCLERCGDVPAGQRPCFPPHTPLPLEPGVAASKVFPCGEHLLVFVALAGYVDWAAHLGAADRDTSREAAVAQVAESSFKLPAGWARVIFPDLAAYPYRD